MKEENKNVAYLFPGQGAQFPGMGKNLFDSSKKAKYRFLQANEILGFSISEIMFGENSKALEETRITQPAIFIHTTIMSEIIGKKYNPNMVAGHSLGEFSALVVSGVFSFEDGLSLVKERALAMQDACEKTSGAMAAILGLEDEIVEKICESSPEIVVAANYNCPRQLVISGSQEGVRKACEASKSLGAIRTLPLSVGGGFHSPLMETAKIRLARAINNTSFSEPRFPVYQNVSAKGIMDSEEIKKNLIEQLTEPVQWKQTIKQMIKDGAKNFIEVGPGNVLKGLVKKIDRTVSIESEI